MPDNMISVRAAVVGGGRSGRAAVRLLQELGANVRLLEKKPENLPHDFVRWAEQNGVVIVGGEHKTEHFAGLDLLIPSPGVAVATLLPLLGNSARPEILAETELAWRQLDGEPVIGITGTSGKTTTTSLCAAMLKAHGLSVFTGGNIGTPLSEYVLERRQGGAKADVLVLELSSFQLQTCCELRPRVGVLLNLAPNHLDYHKDMEEYAQAKMRLFSRQQSGDLALFGSGLETFAAQIGTRCRVAFVDPRIQRFPHTSLLGAHNQTNAEAAWQAAREFGVSEEEAIQAMRDFRPLPHRLERVAEQHGVLYVNDSKATTLEALRVALLAFDRPVLLLAGGKFKGGDPAELNDLIKKRVRAVGLYGACREAFESVWASVVPVSWDPTLRDALARLRDLARPGDAILLAPATASFDQYRDYLERGDDFRCAVLGTEATS